jgi:hypothetical protein
MESKKISVEEIKELIPKLEEKYGELQKCFKADEEFYELDFGARLDLPVEFKSEGIVLPTARDMVDTFVDNIDVANARVKVPQTGSGKGARERAEMMRKIYLGLIYRTNVESDVSPWHVAAKHAAKHGIGVLKTVYDADRWPDKPERITESDEEFAIRTDAWRNETHDALPIVIQAVNPHSILLDPSFNGRGFVIEKHLKMCIDVRNRYPKWSNPMNKDISQDVEFISYWDSNYRCDLIDGEPILKVKGGVAKHNYGFIPYTIIDSGLGDLSIENKPEMRYVGILRYMFDLLIAESRDFSISDIVLKKTAWPWGYLKGENAKLVTTINQKFGSYEAMPEGVEIVEMTPKVPPEALNSHLYRTSDYIAAHAAPRAVRGLGEQGVRSGADRRLVIAQAAARYQYTSQAFQYGAAQVLIKCARLIKNVIPGDFNVWAKTPNDEFDIEVKKEDMKEPFNCYVEFSPINAEDEYTRHDDLERLVSSGIVTKNWARTQMPDVDPLALERDVEREKLRNSPMVQQILEQYLAGKLSAALAKREAAVAPPQPIGQPQQMGQPQGQPGQPQTIPLQGGMIPPTTNRAPLGSAQDMQNQLGQMRSQSPMNPGQGQGIGAGGDRR